jgi:predicted nucleic acid-binding protein
MLFVDTGAWYALATLGDPDHEKAKAWKKGSELFI